MMVWLVIILVVVAAAAAFAVWALRQRFTVETAIDIEAPAHRVWAVLTDFESYGEWNRLFPEASGVPAEGERIEVATTDADGKVNRSNPLVLRVSPARQLRLLRRVGPGLVLDMEHYFTLAPDGDATRLTHGLTCAGVLAPFKRSSLTAEVERDFTALNEALAERARATSGP